MVRKNLQKEKKVSRTNFSIITPDDVSEKWNAFNFLCEIQKKSCFGKDLCGVNPWGIP